MPKLLIAITTALMTGAFATSVAAQPATTSFDQVRYLIKGGDKVAVRDATGATIRGRVVDVSAAWLTLRVRGGQRLLSETDVSRITMRRHDPSLKSALVGGIVPGGIAAGFASAEGTKFAIGAGLIWGGMGAGLGAGVQAIVGKRHLVYERRFRR
jgi:hypothetical protein